MKQKPPFPGPYPFLPECGDAPPTPEQKKKMTARAAIMSGVFLIWIVGGIVAAKVFGLI